MSRIASQQLIRIQSADRQSGYTENDFVVTTRRLLGTYLLEQALIPNTAYHIKTGINDTFQLMEGADTATITIPAGFYTSSTLVTALTTACNVPSTHNNIAASYDSTTGKLSLTDSTPDNLSIVGTAPDLGWSVATATPDATITADNVLVLTTVNTYQVHIDACEGQVTNGTGVISDPTFIVEVGSENSQEFVHYKSESDLRQLIYFPVEQSELHIVLKDEAGRAVDLNGANWSFILRKMHDGPPTAK